MPEEGRTEEGVERCACCGDEVDSAEIVECSRCKRRVCAGCVLVTGAGMCECCEGEGDEDVEEEEDRRDEFEWDDEEEDEFEDEDE